MLHAHRFWRNLASETCQRFRNTCGPRRRAWYPAGDPCQSKRSNPWHPGCPPARSLHSPFLPARRWIHISVFIPFPSLLPPGAYKGPGDPALGNASPPNPIPALHPSPRLPQRAAGSLPAQPGTGSESLSCHAWSHFSLKYPIAKKTTKKTHPRPDATTTFQNHLSGSQGTGLGVTASLPHLGCPCLPPVIKPINESHRP